MVLKNIMLTTENENTKKKCFELTKIAFEEFKKNCDLSSFFDDSGKPKWTWNLFTLTMNKYI